MLCSLSGGSRVPIQHNMAWDEVYLHTKWHLDPSSRFAKIDMGLKVGVLCPFLGGAGSPSNKMSPEPRSTSLPNAILIHAAVWPQQTWVENCGGHAHLGDWIPIWRNVAWGKVYIPTKWHLDPPSRLDTADMGRKLGVVPLIFWKGGGRLGPHQRQCGQGRRLPPCQEASWSIQPFGHNRWAEKWGLLCPLCGGELGPQTIAQKWLNRTRCYLSCGLEWPEGRICVTWVMLAPPGEYDWTVRVRMRCGGSNYLNSCYYYPQSNRCWESRRIQAHTSHACIC